MPADVIMRMAGISAGYGNIRILHNVSFDIAAGDIVGVFGANGAGKTTLLRTISGLTDVFDGDLTIFGAPVRRLAPYHLARLGIAHVPEGRRVFAGMTVRDNLTVAARQRRPETQLLRVYDLFPRLQERAQQRAETLSGGEQQMLAIGRALMTEPRLIMMDEPSQGLSPATVETVVASISRIAADNVTVVVVEQNVNIVLPIVSAAIVVSRGSVRTLSDVSQLAEGDNLSALLLDDSQSPGRGVRHGSMTE
jgi:branched-chain amino acid transport system ATP-binding protein